MKSKVRKAVQRTIGDLIAHDDGPLDLMFMYQNYESSAEADAYSQKYLRRLGKALAAGKVRIVK